MNIFRERAMWQSHRTKFDGTMLAKAIGFVPTMGCLHEGHGTLIKQCMTENKRTIVSLFINPTQFNDASDYESYPITPEADLEQLEAWGVDDVWMPEVSTMYPEGDFFFMQTTHPMATCLEGCFRPGHFNGVLTIVMKLFQLIRPTRAYFGKKDYQQCFLIQKMVADYGLPVEVVACPIHRESSGLPYSSRNRRLSAQGKKKAERICHFLHKAGKTFTNETSFETLKEQVAKDGGHLEYFECLEGRIFFAFQVESIRLIDHFE